MSDYFVDTNILLRLADETSASHKLVTRAVKQMLLNKNKLCIVRQNLAEFWAVATREYKANGLGWTIPQTKQHLETTLVTLNDVDFIRFGIQIVVPREEA